MANISLRSHPSTNHSLLDWRTISSAIGIGMQLVHRHKMEWESHSQFFEFIILVFGRNGELMTRCPTLAGTTQCFGAGGGEAESPAQTDSELRCHRVPGTPPSWEISLHSLSIKRQLFAWWYNLAWRLIP
jgi:hypothetical protein